MSLATRTIRNEPDVNDRCRSLLRTARGRSRSDPATGTILASASRGGDSASPPCHASPPDRRSATGNLALLCVGLAGAFLALEILFRIAGLVAGFGRVGPPPAGDNIVVLCVGDSHTWGRGRGYPAALAALLAERSPRYRVINLGAPGTNTAQLRNRFLDYLDVYRPAVVVHWAGNQQRLQPGGDRGLGRRRGRASRLTRPRTLLDHSRVLRFMRVWRNQWELQRALAAADGYVAPEASRELVEGNTEKHRRRLAGREDVFRSTPTEGLPHDVHVRVTELDLRWMMSRATDAAFPWSPSATGYRAGGWRLRTKASSARRKPPGPP